MKISSNDVIQLNDLFFSTGANSITVSFENMHYKFMSLLEENSTKLPSGHGSCNVVLKIEVPKEDVLKLHRFVLEVKHSPFIFVESKLLRDQIVPQWPIHQNMAFSVLSLNIESVPGTVGMLNLYVQMQWFNYFPYMKNFTFREDWLTQPYRLDNVVMQKSILNYLEETNLEPLEYEPPLLFTGQYHALYPLNLGMAPAREVNSPLQSKVYCRFFNYLQAQALKDSFGISLDEIDLAILNEGNVLLEDLLVSKNELDSIIYQMMAHDYIELEYNVFKFLEVPEDYKKALGTNLNNTLNAAVEINKNINPSVSDTDLLNQVGNYNKIITEANPVLKSEADIILNKMINGNNLSGRKYDAKKMLVFSVWRPDDTKTSGHYHTRILNNQKAPDSFAFDINYMNSNNIGNHFDLRITDKKILSTLDTIGIEIDSPNIVSQINSIYSSINDSEIKLMLTSILDLIADKYMFFMDFGYVIQTRVKEMGLSGKLLWGGDFRNPNNSGHDHLEEELNITNDIFNYTYIKYFANIAATQTSVPSEQELRLLLYPNRQGIPSTDHLHCEITTSYAESNTDYSQVTQGLEIVPFYEAYAELGKLGTKENGNSQDWNNFEQNLYVLAKEGWTLWPSDDINGVFFKTLKFVLPSSTGVYKQYPDGTLDYRFDTKALPDSIRADHILDGSEKDLDTVFTKFSITMRNIINALPIAGSNYPTHQRLGALDNNFQFEFMTQNRADRSTLGTHARQIRLIQESLIANAREIRSIYDSWMCKVNTFATRFVGDYSITSGLYKPKKQVLSSTGVYTIQGYPGLIGMNLNVESSAPNITEALTSTKVNDKKVMKELYKKISSKIAENSYESNFNDFNPFVVSDSNPFLNTVLPVNDLRVNAPLKTLAHNKQENSGYNANEISKIENTYWKIRYIVTIANAIMNEDYKYPIDLYGLEKKYYEPSQFNTIKYLIGNSNIIAYAFFIIAVGRFFENTKDNAMAIINNTNAIIEAFQKTYKEYYFEDQLGDNILNKLVEWVNVIVRLAKAKQDLVNIIVQILLLKDDTNIGFFDWIFNSISITISLCWNILSTTVDYQWGKNFEGKSESELRTQYILELYKGDDIAKFIIPAGLCLSLGSEMGIFNSEFLFTEATLGAISPIAKSIFGGDFALAKDTQYGIFDSIMQALEILSNNMDATLITTPTYEKNKAKLINDMLIEAYNDILNDEFLCKYFGIELTDSLMAANTVDNKPIFDIFVPPHPNTGKTKDVNPDFYYFNLYQDRGFLNDLKDEYEASMDQIISNIGTFTQRQKRGEFNNGLMSGSYSASELAPSFEGDEKAGSSEFSNFVQTEQALTNKVSAIGFNEKKPDVINLNDTINGPGFLTEEIKNIEAQFGKKEGYLDEREEMNTLFKTKNNAEYLHSYKEEDISQISKECLADVFSEKRSMIRTMPAYRLYIIEEDEINDFTLKYDDFRHYNAIDSISYVSNKNIAADVAIITMKNISGILDGTKRLSISDVDYLKEHKMSDGSLTTKGKEIEKGRDKSKLETAEEEPFSSIQLRPGTNVQLRMGYGNDPDLLEVKLSGRVVEISPSKNHELIDIMIQSFAVELEQQPKGLTQYESEYNLTHKLLGSLMLSPELMHFGRIEKERVAMIGEEKSSNIDFKKYDSVKTIDLSRIGSIYNRTYNGIKFLTSWKGILAAVGANFVPGIAGPYLAYNLGNVPIGNIWDITAFYWGNAWMQATTVPKYIWNSQYNPWRKLSDLTYEWFDSLMATPADDNLFPPNPKDYLLAPNAVYFIWKDALGKIKNNPWSQGGYFGGVFKAAKAAGQGVAKLISNPKIELEDLKFIPYGQTIWQIFNEMTYRHPGFAYGARPYGNEMRYTMFFGNPSQRYWSKGAPPLLIKDLNRARLSASRMLNANEPESQEGFNMRDVAKLSTSIFQIGYTLLSFNSPFVIPGLKVTSDYKTYLDTMSNKWTPLKDTSQIEVDFNKLLDYYKVLTYRFVPFRRYHYASSDLDIISNNIILSDYNVANALSVKYYNYNSIFSEDELEGSLLVKAHPRINDSDLKIKEIDFPNCRGPKMALRYGVSGLMNELRNGYDGSLLLVGNPRINPWDIVLIYDKYNDMAGPIEVGEVIHKISFQDGFITEIRPEALVISNEVSSLPALEAVKTITSSIHAKMEKEYLMGTTLDDTAEVLKGDPNLDFYQETGIEKFIIKDPKSAPNQALATAFNSGCFLLGSYLYYLSVSTKDPLIVYPLIKNGMPFVAGFPPGMKDTLLTIFMGNIQSIQKDMEKGTIHFLDYWSELGLDGVKMVSNSLRNYRVNKTVRNTP